MAAKAPKHRFILKGFLQQGGGGRKFLFDSIDGETNERTEVTVYADLTLLQVYGIRMQELPLLCLEFLERQDLQVDARTLVFTEQEMIQLSSVRKAARATADEKRKTWKKRPVGNTGVAWRAAPAVPARIPE